MKNHFMKSGMNRKSEPFADRLLVVRVLYPLVNSAIAVHAASFMTTFMSTGFLDGFTLLHLFEGGKMVTQVLLGIPTQILKNFQINLGM